MSYARFGEGDVYVYRGPRYWECCGCKLEGGPGTGAWRNFRFLRTLLRHLREHQKAGHKVPRRCIARINREMKEGQA